MLLVRYVSNVRERIVHNQINDMNDFWLICRNVWYSYSEMYIITFQHTIHGVYIHGYTSTVSSHTQEPYYNNMYI